MQTTPNIKPNPNRIIKIKPISTELTVAKVTNFNAALRPKPCKAPLQAELWKYECWRSLVESV